jgi:hypothetical protein
LKHRLVLHPTACVDRRMLFLAGIASCVQGIGT